MTIKIKKLKNNLAVEGITPIQELLKKPEYTLAELLKSITKENTHELIDWGPDVGKEILEPWQP